jgi:hypothetical protein
MATSAIHPTRQVSIGIWVVPGVVAGMVFAMWAMVVGLFTSSVWAPPQGIAQAVDIGTQGHVFQATPFVVGIMAHMLNAVILGALFVAIARALRLTSTGSLIASGMMYGLAVYGILFWLVVRGLLTSNSNSFLTANPEWSWIVAHAMFGVALGGLTALFFGRETIRPGASTR